MSIFEIEISQTGFSREIVKCKLRERSCVCIVYCCNMFADTDENFNKFIQILSSILCKVNYWRFF